MDGSHSLLIRLDSSLALRCRKGAIHPSFDHLVGKRQKLVGNLEAKRLRGLEVNHQLELGRLHDRQGGRLGSFENLPGIHSDLAKCFGEVCAVGDEPPGRNVFAPIINRGNFEVCRQHDNLMKSAEEEWVCAYNECPASVLGERSESIIDVTFAAGVKDHELLSKVARRRLHVT